MPSVRRRLVSSKVTLRMTRVHRGGNRGQLVDDDVRLRAGHRLGDLIAIEGVGDHRHGAQLDEQRPLRRAARHAMDVMTRGDQARHKLPADRSRRSCHKYPHHRLSSLEVKWLN